MSTENTTLKEDINEERSKSDDRRIVVGILASFVNFERREAQRETWLASSKIEHKYIIDKWTPEWKAENDIFGDIVSINASFSGDSKGFGEKLYHWFQYAADNYPEGTIVGKTDDDFYGCANLFDTVIENYHPRMYFGWWHEDWPNSEKLVPNLRNCHDAQFVTISWQLMKEILRKPYCHHKRDASFCTAGNNQVRFGSDYGETSLGHWLGQLGNITVVAMNERMVHSEEPEKFRSPLKKPYCGEMVSYHKTTPPLQRYLECFDQNITKTKQFCYKAENMASYDGKLDYKPKNAICEDVSINYDDIEEEENKKLLIPLLVWGPNNQLQGFRESVYFANALGRSLAAPVFFPNWNQHSSKVPAQMRLEIFSLLDIASIVDPSKIASFCQKKVTANLKTRRNGDQAHLKAALDFYGVEIDSNAEVLSVPAKKYEAAQFTDGIDKSKIKEFFDSDEKCAILYFPWNTIDIEEISKQALLENNERSADYNEIFEIIKHTRRPVYVREAAVKFLRESKIDDFVSIHWRYDSKDYFRNALPKKTEAMDLIKSVKESDELTQKLALELSNVMKSKSAVYFASPPAEKQFIRKLFTKIYESDDGIKEIKDSLLVSFLKREFAECAAIMEDFEGLLSLVEMELCFLSSTFVYSCFSTWRQGCKFFKIFPWQGGAWRQDRFPPCGGAGR